jgi:hypothetical protein
METKRGARVAASDRPHWDTWSASISVNLRIPRPAFPLLCSLRSFAAAFISGNLRQSADPPSGPPEKTVIESIESTESLSHTSSRPTFALAGRAAGGGRLDDEKRPPVAARCAPRRGDQPAQGHERKADRMTSACPARHSFSGGGPPSLSAIASAAADAFFLVHPPLPSWTSWLRVRPPSSRETSVLPAFPVRHGFSGGGSLLPCPSSPSFVDFVASCETSPPRQNYPERP